MIITLKPVVLKNFVLAIWNVMNQVMNISLETQIR